VAFLVRRHKVSERRACRVVGQHRSTQRYAAVPGDFEQRLVKAMRALAETHPRWGYRRIHALLQNEGWPVNLKRVHRLWRLEGLVVPARRKKHGKKAPGTDQNSAWALPAVRVDHIWSYDFLATRTADGGPLRVLNIVDEYTREAVGSHVARSIGGPRRRARAGAAVRQPRHTGDHPLGQRPRVHRRHCGRLAR
jgi:transposase InsO family protein